MKAISFAVLCLVSVIGMVQSAPAPFKISMVELRPAEVIKTRPIETKSAGAIYKDCSASTDTFKVKDVIVEGCSTPPCILKKGTNVSVQIDFTAEEVTPNVTAKVYGVIAGVDVKFPLPNPDACTTGVTCPTKSGATYTYKNNLLIESVYPDIQLVVLWYLYDGQNHEALCIDVLVKITS
ncbi:NPC intracellular cholesterol transporter 2-like [Diadema antillarum]|uniref:NPC intracellular cholesterol transporter 2-like n=1 Tax=Diadema antillarum TaxID=105358 RepID=UPI003A8827BC